MITELSSNQEILVLSIFFGAANQINEGLKKAVKEAEPSNWLEKNEMFILDDCYVGYPDRGAAHKKRLISLSPKSNDFSLFTANLEDGWNSLAFGLSADIGCEALILGFSNRNVEYPVCFFSFVKNGKLLRHVSVRLDDRWLFHQQGAPLPVEDLTKYEARIIRNRLTNDQLVKLAGHYGVELNQIGQLRCNGMLLYQY
jgi:hypothetical protein